MKIRDRGTHTHTSIPGFWPLFMRKRQRVLTPAQGIRVVKFEIYLIGFSFCITYPRYLLLRPRFSGININKYAVYYFRSHSVDLFLRALK